ncbi:hypothetical protein B0O80DRAFT_447017 [Mortierella sp. GBAus27b]|nr:hypothetical protein B0O80DRAFT_447017 [Mortierella sp. GBAus27b]
MQIMQTVINNDGHAVIVDKTIWPLCHCYSRMFYPSLALIHTVLCNRDLPLQLKVELIKILWLFM